MRGVVFAARAADYLLVERSQRALKDIGFAGVAAVLGEGHLQKELTCLAEPVLICQAGSWPLRALPSEIPRSATGLPLVAYGRSKEAAASPRISPEGNAECATPLALYLEPAAAARLCDLLASSAWSEAVALLLEDAGIRSVHLPELAMCHDAALRVLQVVTTIQIGGAERVALDLAEGLSRRGCHVWVAAFSRPPRAAFGAPPGFFDLSNSGRSPEARAAAVAKILHGFHLDLVHAHLISGPECAALHRAGLPLAVTIHNMPQSWPPGFAEGGKKADLLIPCSQSIAREMDEVSLGSPVRVAWNGIAAGRYAPTGPALEKGRAWRIERGWNSGDLVIISVANPRAQKRLERIPAVIVELQRRLPQRKVRCILAGEAAATSLDGQAAQRALVAAIEQSGMQEQIVRIEGVHDVSVLLWASDAFLSTSSFEGLSLAQLEVLAAGLPVVTTNVGGAPEIAREMKEEQAWFQRLPVEASAADFAEALLRVPQPERNARLPAAFHRERMCARMEQLYAVALTIRQRAHLAPSGLWLFTNNFSMGGAQSSARRLLARLKERGVDVRAFTVQEGQPTRGSTAIKSLGIPVMHLAPELLKTPEIAAREVLGAGGAAPPRAVLFWNLISSYKLLLADGLPGIDVFDVSPGEMNYTALERYFRAPRPELPYRTGGEYGSLLAGAVVKYAGEQQVAEDYLGRSAAVIRNGVDLQERTRSGPNGKLIFGTAARISPDKRIEDLVSAFVAAHQQLPDYELRIAGKVEQGADAYAQQLRAAGSELPIRWLGELPGTADFLDSIDIFVMISEPQGCPNASLEAMAAGLPVIATDVGGAREQVIDAETGRLVPRRDPAAFAAALIALARDGEARQRYGRAAMARIEREFSVESMANRYTQLCLNGR